MIILNVDTIAKLKKEAIANCTKELAGKVRIPRKAFLNNYLVALKENKVTWKKEKGAISCTY